jgi:mono/diheme cytochrome c family protein
MSIQCARAVPVVLGALTLISVSGSVGFATEAAYQTHCSKCHSRAATLARNLKGDTRDERAAALSKFLEDHHLGDPAARAAIVKYLVEQTDP